MSSVTERLLACSGQVDAFRLGGHPGFQEVSSVIPGQQEEENAKCNSNVSELQFRHLSSRNSMSTDKSKRHKPSLTQFEVRGG
jgi:hypothetical protein